MCIRDSVSLARSQYCGAYCFFNRQFHDGVLNHKKLQDIVGHTRTATLPHSEDKLYGAGYLHS